MEYDHTPPDWGSEEEEEEILGVSLIRRISYGKATDSCGNKSITQIESYIWLEKNEAISLIKEVYTQETPIPFTESQWQDFIMEFFPGWGLHSLIV